ncbi:hypothetical protein V3C99_010145 [Haemonchus contortus]|uniref:Uncharacterized protein n=1 Tax=Haemonchus contortus TaxID=6289 RepID=A0A7I4YXR7_HAECO
MEIEAMLTRRRYADHTWDSCEDNCAPMPKRVCCEGDLVTSKDGANSGNFHALRDSGMDMDINCNECATGTKGNNANETKDQQLSPPSAAGVHHVEVGPNVRKDESNMVQIFPQTVPIYEHRPPVNHFSYCDRSAFSRHLFY